MGNQNTEVATTGRLRLEFKNEKPLDEFAVTCFQNDVPFAYGGDLSISMSRRAFEELPPSVRSQLTQLEEQGTVSSGAEQPHSGRRRVLTAEEAGEALRKLIPEKFLPRQ